jgi:uncharacterized OsmC-like protein
MTDLRTTCNGISLDELRELAGAVHGAPDPVPLRIRTRSRWDDGVAFDNRGDTVEAFGESADRAHHLVRSDLPVALGGADTGPAPTELLLSALAACITSTFVEGASLEGIEIGDIDVAMDTRIDLRGAFGVDGVSPGPVAIDVRLAVRADADAGTLRQLGEESVRLSPTADTVARPVAINLIVEQRS